MRNKRRMAMLLMAAVSASLFSGCGAATSGTDPSVHEGESNTGAEVEPSAGERPKVTILTNLNVDTEGKDVNDNDYIHYIEDQNGIDIELINEPSSSNYPQKLNTVMASNEIPDAVMLMGDTQRSDLARLADEGFLLPLDDLIGDYPNLTTNIKQAAWDVTKHNGSTYAVPFQRYDSSPYMTFIRRDWLEALDINPETDLVTIDDWYNVMKRFAEEDPDGNGEADRGITHE